MIQIGKASSYIIVMAIAFFSALFGYIATPISFILTETVMIASIYMLYLFVNIDKKYAFLHAVVGSIIINMAYFCSDLPKIFYELIYSNTACNDEFATLGGLVIIIFFAQLLFWGIIYLVTSNIHKKDKKV